MRVKYTVICACNNKILLDDYLIKSLNNQSFKEFELIIIDTINNQYNGAVSAFNDSLKKCNSDYIIFVHQDLMLEQDVVLRIDNFVNEIKEFGVIGIAGSPYGAWKTIGNLTTGNNEASTREKILMPQLVQTVDEVLFVVKKSQLLDIGFDKDNKTWHLYAVELCLRMSRNNLNNYVIPVKAYHLSPGYSLDSTYYDELYRLMKTYKFEESYLNTTMGVWYKNRFHLLMQVFKGKMRLIMKQRRGFTNAHKN